MEFYPLKAFEPHLKGCVPCGYLRHEGKVGRLIDLAGSTVAMIADLQVLIRRPLDAFSIKFENDGQRHSFFQALVTALKDQAPFIDTAEEGLKYLNWNEEDRTVDVYVEGGAVSIDPNA